MHTMRMEENGQKVLAIKRALEVSDADYVLVSDFDSRIINPEDIPIALQRFEEDPRVAALSLKLVPRDVALQQASGPGVCNIQGNHLQVSELSWEDQMRSWCGWNLGQEGLAKCDEGAQREAQW